MTSFWSRKFLWTKRDFAFDELHYSIKKKNIKKSSIEL